MKADAVRRRFGREKAKRDYPQVATQAQHLPAIAILQLKGIREERPKRAAAKTQAPCLLQQATCPHLIQAAYVECFCRNSQHYALKFVVLHAGLLPGRALPLLPAAYPELGQWSLLLQIFLQTAYALSIFSMATWKSNFWPKWLELSIKKKQAGISPVSAEIANSPYTFSCKCRLANYPSFSLLEVNICCGLHRGA